MAELPDPDEPHSDVAGYLLGTLTNEEAQRFASHLPACEVCRTELDDLGGLPGLLARMTPDEPLPDGLEERTFDAIERAATHLSSDAGPGLVGVVGAGVPGAGVFAGGRAATAWEAPTGAVSAGAPTSGPNMSDRSVSGDDRRLAGVIPISTARRRDRVRPRTPWLMAVAAIVAIVVVGVAVIPTLHKSRPAPLATVALVAPNHGPARGTATIRATLTGLTIDLRVTGMRPSPPKTFYTCWLVGPGDSLAHQDRVSVGSFLVGASGAADLQWVTGASLERFPTLGVTLEPDNGDPLHQGPKVLEAV